MRYYLGIAILWAVLAITGIALARNELQPIVRVYTLPLQP